MLQLYLRALLAGYPAAGSLSDSPYLVGETFFTKNLPARMTWQNEVTEAIREGRKLLSATTSFPRAGSINTAVTIFAELCVDCANTCPPLAREAISVLWWAQTLTFQSQSVLRHLTRQLALVGDSADARRTFELYVKLVLKTRQTQQPDVSLQLKRRPTDDVPAGPQDIQRQANEAEFDKGLEPEGQKTEIAEAEVETDPQFLAALLVGSRLLLRDLHEAEEAWLYACLAEDVVSNLERMRRIVSPVLKAGVEECKGIVRMNIAMLG